MYQLTVEILIRNYFNLSLWKGFYECNINFIQIFWFIYSGFRDRKLKHNIVKHQLLQIIYDTEIVSIKQLHKSRSQLKGAI